jgi:hypothetical protein
MPERRDRSWIAAAAIAAVAATPIIVVVAIGPPGAGPTAVDSFAVLASPAQPGAPAFDWVTMGFVVDETRYLGNALDTDVWAGVDNDGGVCLAVDPHVGNRAVATCVNLSDAERTGVTIRSETTDAGAVAVYLVPDDVDLTQPLGSWQILAGRALVSTVEAVNQSAIVVLQREDGDDIRLDP